MTSRLTIILSFVLATLLAAGAVELLYRSLDRAMTKDKKIAVTRTEDKPGSAIPPKTKAQSRQKTPAAKKEDYTIITKRNLFGKVAATPIKQEPKAEPVLTTTSLDLTLLGTIGGDSSDQRAIIRDKKKNTQEIYYKGDAISRALIKTIYRGKIILTVNGRDEVLLMQESKSPPGSSRPSGKSQNFTMPDVYSPDVYPPEDIEDIDDLELEEGYEQPENIPPPAAPKRRMTLKPKNKQVTEP